MKRVIVCLLALLCVLSACTPYMYGVPQDSWDRMSESERIAAMRVYEREQQARRQAEEERARRWAIEEQARRQAAEERARIEAQERQREQARQAALERELHERIEAIHRGAGAYGQLIRVRLQGGNVKVGERLYRYEPVTFSIAEGETRRISVADQQGRIGELNVTYGGGAFQLEGTRFPYDRSWGRGHLYSHTAVPGTIHLRDADVFIEVHERSTRLDREQQRMLLFREPEPPVVIREREHRQPEPVVVRPYEPPKPPPVRPPAPPVVERAPRSLELALLSGEIRVYGRSQALEKTALRLSDGETREVVVKAAGEKRMITFSYRNGELAIDGTPGSRGHDAVRIGYEKEWKSGKIYRIELKGRERNDTIELKVSGIQSH